MSDTGYYSYTMKLTLQSPFLIAGSQPSHYGIDVVQIRDLGGNPIIPDTHIKGVLRHAWTMLEAEGIVAPLSTNRLFGLTRDKPEGGTDELHYGDAQGLLSFTDLVTVQPRNRDAVTRVSIVDATGAADDGALVTVELAAGAGKELEFSGSFTAHCLSLVEAVELRHKIELALGAIEAIGRFKTVGFGRILHAEVGEPQAEVRAPLPPGAAQATDFELAFRLNKRVLVDINRVDSNTLSGSEIIPGTALKGALARRLALAGKKPLLGDLRRVLSRMLVSQAVPHCLGTNLSGIPLSSPEGLNRIRIGKSDGAVWHPETLNFNKSLELATFLPDWKDDEPDSARPALRRDVRTRVRIDADSGAAKTGALFTQSAIAPEAWLESTSSSLPIEWRCTIRWPGASQGADYDIFIECLETLGHGLHSLGKTNAQTVDLRLTIASPVPNAGPHPVGPFVVTLDSPTLMIRERHLASESLYAEALDTYWREISGGCLAIAPADDTPVYGSANVGPQPLDFYCHQEFRSGYAALRFRYFGPDRVEPFVLSKPGSVFVLMAIDVTEAAPCLAKLQKAGLPVARWSDEVEGLGTIDLLLEPDFEVCPFGPQNGYGAISVAKEDGQ